MGGVFRLEQCETKTMRLKTKKTYDEQMLDLVRQYRDENGEDLAASIDMAAWMVKKNKWAKTNAAMVQICARDISKALRSQHYFDDQGRRVRTNLAVRRKRALPDGSEKYKTLWGDVRHMGRDDAELGFSQRRAQVAGECKQLSTDVTSFNEHNCPDEPIPMLFDFTADIAEDTQPASYAFGRDR